ncbi:hypothetical protein CFE70_001067 [Pyrenophora teres f. teres 0-1]|uniref:EthD domain-containing protein n=2 Tax=Pyrenophora teres f. teres TaxID=97479 RepID=E3RLK0_PYRTT|nr:hypothetical protein PTT_09253 [Pyrenophora teres f. teres 0-1]KAE8822819.1 hypothetical protein HRS9139_10159 [Pyrenophora teres f. teres]CAA9957489.1 ethyl tert-butyl ether degradation ethD [Pyrenophora teres f. maculata]KAE8826053.1 hypothetical protein PTNB85_08998 [Pyrenophora teres f. teres]KAE8832938.1 hypothetical protein HRS9122_08651 [Pyrenophora teres f. teres]
MSSQVLVLYPRTPTSTFNKDYYLSTHMDLVKSVWGKYGLKSYSVVETSPESGSPYAFITVMDYESKEAFGEAVKDERTKEVMADVEKFTNVKPEVVTGGVVARG